MNKLLVALTLSATVIATAAMGASNGWWHTVSVMASQHTPADHNQVCANAAYKLRAKYSDVTTIRHGISFDQYNGLLYCTATGQSQQ
ncbi:MAG: hypothetical protein HRT53_16135 [Colwellia sp.]|nr:hypothetical protein [Colwellia sp.]